MPAAVKENPATLLAEMPEQAGVAGVCFAPYASGMTDPPSLRECLGFRRTECGCASCQVFCRHLPGALDPSDLSRLCPPGQELFAWAEQHLRALLGKPYPTLVPARRQGGGCHWYFDGKCVVHEDAPYCCAFFDAHMPEAEVARRVAATVQTIQQDVATGGLYYQVWRHLCRKGLTGRSGDRAALLREVQKIKRRAESHSRRAQTNSSASVRASLLPKQ